MIAEVSLNEKGEAFASFGFCAREITCRVEAEIVSVKVVFRRREIGTDDVYQLSISMGLPLDNFTVRETSVRFDRFVTSHEDPERNRGSFSYAAEIEELIREMIAQVEEAKK